MNLSHKSQTLEDNLQSCIEHPFKKARYAWQIKGYIGPANRQCLPIACTSDLNNTDDGFHGNRIIETYDRKVCKAEQDIYCASTQAETSQHDGESFDVRQNYMCDTDMGCIKNKVEYHCPEGVDQNEALCSKYDKNCFKRKCEPVSACDETKARIKRVKVKSAESSVESMNTISDYSLPNESPEDDNNVQENDLSSYMWQKREMGFAIVDNVCNETLEVMGISPDPKVNMIARARLALEDHGIETAIKNQGLFANAEKKSETEPDMDVFVDDFEHKDDSIENCVRSNEFGNVSTNTFRPGLSSGSSDNHLVSSKMNIHGYNDSKTDGYGLRCEHHDGYSNYGDEITSENVVDSTESCNIYNAMDHSDSSETVAIRKNSDIVIDLAVSAAIITQGLSFEKSS